MFKPTSAKDSAMGVHTGNIDSTNLTVIGSEQANQSSTNLTVIGSEQANQSLRELKETNCMYRQHDIGRLDNKIDTLRTNSYNNKSEIELYEQILGDATYLDYLDELNFTDYDVPEGFDECECCAKNKYEKFNSSNTHGKCSCCSHYREEHDKNYYY